jgi:HAD superfamily hydrolase (TIGR01490 family)
MGVSIAFFDVDGTIMRGTTGMAAIKYYLANGRFGPQILLKGAYYQLMHYFDIVDHEEMMQNALEPFVGQDEESLYREMQETFVKYIKPLLFQEALDEISRHKAASRNVVLLSASSIYAVSRIAEFLGTEFIASSAVIRSGRLTAELVKPICYKEGKLVLAREYCAKAGAKLDDCLFYSDSASDIPLLEAVGHPVAVNPDLLLAREAKKRKWETRKYKAILATRCEAEVKEVH